MMPRWKPLPVMGPPTPAAQSPPWTSCFSVDGTPSPSSCSTSIVVVVSHCLTAAASSEISPPARV